MNKNPSYYKTYDFIVKFIKENGYQSTFREICSGTGIKSTSTMARHIEILNNMGLIQFNQTKSRAVVIKEYKFVNENELPKWYSIKEKLPDTDDTFTVLFDDGTQGTASHEIYYGNKHSWTISRRDLIKRKTIIAWYPNPVITNNEYKHLLDIYNQK